MESHVARFTTTILVVDPEDVVASWKFLAVVANSCCANSTDPCVSLGRGLLISGISKHEHKTVLWRASLSSWEVTGRVHVTSHVNILGNWVGKPDGSAPTRKCFGHLLYFESLLKHGESCVVVLADEGTVWHKESTIVCFHVINLTLDTWILRPQGRTVTPRSLVVLSSPWVSQLGKSSLLPIGKCHIVNIQEGVSMTADEAIRTTALAACCGHWVVVTGEPFVEIIHCRAAEGTLVVDQVGRHTSDGSHSLISIASIKSVVVLIELCVGFFEEWHPPSTRVRSPGGPRSESIGPVPTWKSIVDVDAPPSIFGIEIEAEDTMLVVASLSHDSLDTPSLF